MIGANSSFIMVKAHFLQPCIPCLHGITTAVILSMMLAGCADEDKRHVSKKVAPKAPAGSAEFKQSTGTLLGQGFAPGNQIQTLANGDQIFPAMLTAIRNARKSVNFETYVFNNGDIGKKFTEVLSERARAGSSYRSCSPQAGSPKVSAPSVLMASATIPPPCRWSSTCLP